MFIKRNRSETETDGFQIYETDTGSDPNPGRFLPDWPFATVVDLPWRTRKSSCMNARGIPPAWTWPTPPPPWLTHPSPPGWPTPPPLLTHPSPLLTPPPPGWPTPTPLADPPLPRLTHPSPVADPPLPPGWTWPTPPPRLDLTHPPRGQTEGQTRVKTLPSPILRMRAVNIHTAHKGDEYPSQSEK